MEWVKLFKRQNQLCKLIAGFLSVTGVVLHLYSLSGTKYDVIEYCFKPKVINNKSAKYCTDDKKYIAPKGFYEQEKYAPANPRFQRENIFVINDKMTRLRDIPATNKQALNYTASGLLLLSGATFLTSQRIKRYRREFAAYFENLKTDLNQTISLNEQQREVENHKIATETNYVKDRITIQDEAQRYQDKSRAQRDFETEQSQKHNELVEYQRQLQIAQFKAQIAKLESEEAKFKSEANRHLSTIAEPIELAEEIDYEALCPGKVGELEFYDWRDLADDAVGIIIAGNSGSGKTSVAVWVAGWLTKDEPAQIIALDPHANINVLWQELGIHAISSFELIEQQLNLFISLLDERRGFDKAKLDLEPTIIVFGDEINACLDNFEAPETIELALKRLGSEGRKYKIVFIALNQSSNANDLNISAQMRNNYLLIALNATARQLAKQWWKKDDPRFKHVEQLAYSCTVSGSVPESLAVHPTHHSYKQFKKKGNKPKGLLPINQLPLTIELAAPQTKEKDWYESFVEWHHSLGRAPNPTEIAEKWLEVMGREASSKQVEEIHEYLKNLG